MVQALCTKDGSLPQGLIVQKTYTELRQGGKKAVGGKEQYCILTDPLEENTGGQGSGSITCAQTP